jgi:hypothetical protein
MSQRTAIITDLEDAIQDVDHEIVENATERRLTHLLVTIGLAVSYILKNLPKDVRD